MIINFIEESGGTPGVLIKQDKNVEPSISAFSVKPDDGYNALNKVTISAVTSDIDSNITPSNIKSGVSILGVTGDYSFNYQSKEASPSTQEQDIVCDSSYDGLSQVTISPVTSAIDENIIPYNIKEGVSILGVSGTARPAPVEWVSSTSNISVSSEALFPNLIKKIDFNGGNFSSVSTLLSTMQGLDNLEEVNMGYTFSNVTKAESCFMDCHNLTRVIMPGGLNSLRDLDSTFYNCYSLPYVEFPSDMTSMVDMIATFGNCSSLTEVTLPNDMPNLRNISSMCINCTQLTELGLPPYSSKIIDMYGAFNGCSSLVDVGLPEMLTMLTNMEDTFRNCASLTSLYMNDIATSVLSNMSATFFNCINLTEVVLPQINTAPLVQMRSAFMSTGITTMNLSEWTHVRSFYQTFKYCSNLESVTMPSTMSECEYLYHTFYGCESLTSITLPGDMTALSTCYSMFSECYNLKEVSMPGTIGWSDYLNTRSMFHKCSSLERIDLSINRLSNMWSMFNGCNNLTEVNLSINGACGTPTYAFLNCSSLKEMRLPKINTSSNMSHMFENCTSLTYVEWGKYIFNPGTTATNQQDMFKNTPLLSDIVFTSTIAKQNLTGWAIEDAGSAVGGLTLSCLEVLIAMLASSTTNKTITLGTTNLNKLTPQLIQQATNKGWTLI